MNNKLDLEFQKLNNMLKNKGEPKVLPDGRKLYRDPNYSGAFFEEEDVLKKIANIEKEISRVGNLTLRHKKARKLIARALAKGGCPEPWHWARVIVRGDNEIVEYEYCGWRKDDDIPLYAADVWIKNPIIINGYEFKNDGEETGRIRITRVRDGKFCFSTNL